MPLPPPRRSLHKVHDEDGKKFEIEASWICDETNKEHQRVSALNTHCRCGVPVCVCVNAVVRA